MLQADSHKLAGAYTGPLCLPYRILCKTVRQRSDWLPM